MNCEILSRLQTYLHKSQDEISGHTFPLYIVLLVCLAAPSVPADPTTSPTYNERSDPTAVNNKTD